MSRTKPRSTGSSNPATKFLQWNTKASTWEFYDKEAQESRTLPLDTRFIILDQLITAKGWDDRKNSAIWSNEVYTVGDKLTLRNKEGIVATGTWSEVRTLNGVKFTKSVYAMAKIGEGFELVNFQLKGCAMSEWIEFERRVGGSNKLEGDVVIAVTEAVEDRKGAVSYNKPFFNIVSNTLSNEAALQADMMDVRLQEYLSSYLKVEKPKEDDDEDDAPDPAAAYHLNAYGNEPEVEVIANPF
jgi:hypothetical protein